MTRREPENCRRNQGRFHSLGQVCRIPGCWAGGGRRIGGVNLIRALARNCGNQSLECEGRSTSGNHHEARVPKSRAGTDQLVGAMMAGNAVGAKGLGQAAVFVAQLVTGGSR
jgi:hypothetical protein